MAAICAFNGLKAATVLDQAAKKPFGVSNGYTTSAMMVWTPNDNKFFETMSYLPPLTAAEIGRQIDYIVRSGWTPCLEFSAPDTAFTLAHDSGNSQIVSSATCGYYDNRYWAMWKLPMFGCTDSSQVLNEVSNCTRAFPGCFVRVAGFDNVKQVQCASFIVHRPPGYEAIPTNQRSI
mmetsp:Transcript_42054/g.80421  ORF Transcript_42054/g.80421 Transcript_42054/m.80421 type:complete len:177 (+) Transcript_42054:3046-3576(+)